MPFMDYFRKFFNLPPRTEDDFSPRSQHEMHQGDSFRNPIWQSDEDEDDVSDFSDRHNSRGGLHFKVFGDPFEMTKFFESQMDEMLKGFFHSFESFDNGHSHSSVIVPFGNDHLSEQPKGKSLRDQFLKSGYDLPSKNEPKEDQDLDGKVSSKDLAKMWENHSRGDNQVLPQFSVKSFGKSVSTRIITRPDGTVEQHQSVKDSEGNEEIKVTRQIGDKIHTVITKRTKDGTEDKKEDLINMDEGEVKDFDKKWSNPPASNDFPWHKFFGPNPKL